MQKPVPPQVLLIDKPAGLTSFGVVARVRRVLTPLYQQKYQEAKLTPPRRLRVGHTGTLDPFATGLLIVLVDSATKQSNSFLKLDKEYIATLHLGATSTTGDPEGTVQKSYSGAPIPLDKVKKVVQSFLGTIPQKVPAFSAVKIHGHRAYELARKGQPVPTPTKNVTIYSLDILNYSWPSLTLKASVSSGTYIRSLAEDIGKQLGTGAYLTALRRTKIANYSVDDALPLDYFLSNY